MNAENIEIFSTSTELATQLAHEIAEALSSAIEHRGSASIAFSGGSTPIQLFETLNRKAIKWEAVNITLVDERCVLDDHPRSNAQLVRKHLLREYAGKATFFPLFHDDEKSPSQNAQIANFQNKALLPLDIAVLGMGNDGHTASFFPDAVELPDALENSEPAIIDIHAESAGEDRLTYNYAALSRAGKIFLHIEGKDKWHTLEKARANDAPDEMPIRAFFKLKNQPIRIFWSPKV